MPAHPAVFARNANNMRDPARFSANIFIVKILEAYSGRWIAEFR
jgi:hypothetical protein